MFDWIVMLDLTSFVLFCSMHYYTIERHSIFFFDTPDLHVAADSPRLHDSPADVRTPWPHGGARD